VWIVAGIGSCVDWSRYEHGFEDQDTYHLIVHSDFLKDCKNSYNTKCIIH
jgi:hypothetical protein